MGKITAINLTNEELVPNIHKEQLKSVKNRQLNSKIGERPEWSLQKNMHTYTNAQVVHCTTLHLSCRQRGFVYVFQQFP